MIVVLVARYLRTIELPNTHRLAEALDEAVKHIIADEKKHDATRKELDMLLIEAKDEVEAIQALPSWLRT